MRSKEAFVHCAKSIAQSNIWKHENWPSIDDLAKRLISSDAEISAEYNMVEGAAHNLMMEKCQRQTVDPIYQWLQSIVE